MNTALRTDLRRGALPLFIITATDIIIAMAMGFLNTDPRIVFVAVSCLVSIPVGGFFPAYIHSPGFTCGWWTYEVAIGTDRRDIVNARFVTATILPGVVSLFVTLIAGARCHVPNLILMVIVPTMMCVMLSSSTVASHFITSRCNRTMNWILATVAVFGCIIMLLSYENVATSETTLATVSLVVAMVIASANYLMSLSEFSKKDL